MAIKEIRTTISPLDTDYLRIFLTANNLDNIAFDYYTVPDELYYYVTRTYVVLSYDDTNEQLVGDIVALSLRHGSLQHAMLDFADKCRAVY